MPLRIGIARCGAAAGRRSARESKPWAVPGSGLPQPPAEAHLYAAFDRLQFRLGCPAITRRIISPIICSTSVGWALRGWSQDSAGAREAMPTPRRCSYSTTPTRSTRLRLIRSRAATVTVSPRRSLVSSWVQPGRSLTGTEPELPTS